MRALTLFAPDPEATDAIGAALAAHLSPGEAVLLSGGLGAGKSALARALIRAFLRDPDLEVPSPTFALVQPYSGLMHADLYRLSEPDEIDELGLFDDSALCLLVEWPERAPALRALPGYDLDLAIPPGGEGRLITLSPRGDRDSGLLIAALAPWTKKPGDLP